MEKFSVFGKNQMYFRPVKSLGQNFLVNEGIARIEAEYARNRTVLEIGSGYGILTRELCITARRVVAVEKDLNLFSVLKAENNNRNLKLINADFFKADDAELEVKDIDILVSNIPYNLSSKVIEWVIEKGKEALLCMQKEFVDHMLANEGTRKYSKLSVVSHLTLSTTKIMDVPRGNFRPIPKVDSAIVLIKPKSALDRSVISTIGAIMEHKKKTVRNAIIDSHAYLGVPKKEAAAIADEIGEEGPAKLFMLSPERILEIAMRINAVRMSTRAAGLPS